MDSSLLEWRFCRILERYPYAGDFFPSFGLPAIAIDQTIGVFLKGLAPEQMEELGLDVTRLAGLFLSFIERMDGLNRNADHGVCCVTVLGGHDKDGQPEHPLLELQSGEVVAVVGPTGSGKSMLLADVECLAQADTPSGRRILINNRVPGEEERLSGEHRLVAQLSQNMNFVMDMPVKEFLCLHAESRLIRNIDAVVAQIFTMAVSLAGEPFGEDTPVTSLSGGQSRALMIADVACLSASPIVLIDEIENAGVDRRKALNLLIKKEKIVLIATHDPLLTFSCGRRVVIRNGGIAAVLETSDKEKALLGELDAIDARLTLFRNQLRRGDMI